MPGRRDNNLRGGDLAEGFGCELLRHLCAVAPVPREEDFGLDAVCTVLRREGRTLHAGATFGVQIKSATVRNVVFDEDSALWLHDLDIPFFVMSVDLAAGRASLYSTEGYFIARMKNKVTFLLDRPAKISNLRLLGKPDGWTDGFGFWVGDPVIDFSFADLQDPAFCERTRILLSAWCEAVKDTLVARRIGYYQKLAWTRGAPPVVSGGGGGGGGTKAKEVFIRLLEKTAPHLSRMRILLHELKEAELDNNLRRLALKAVEFGASPNGFALMLMPEQPPARESGRSQAP